jgi:hypothetical protein
MAGDVEALRRGVSNLLEGCAGARRGESLLIVREDPACGYYGAGLAEAVAERARAFGLDVRTLDVPFVAAVEEPHRDLAAAMRGADHVLFLARLGDQLRFKAMPPGCKPIVSYVLDLESMASAFGRAPYAAFVRLKAAFDALFSTGGEIRVACPLGTEIVGRATSKDGLPRTDVTVKRFPLSVFAPIEAASFAGRVAVAHLLCGTGSRYYEPYGIALGGALTARIAAGRLVGWEGPAAEVARARAHYADVASRFGIDGGVVHSWHAGLHPGCAYRGSAHDDYARWSGSAFGNPRLLHFHTCGDYAPGEICWNLVDPTIEVDGVRVWDRGRIVLDAVPGARAVVDEGPGMRELFERPAQAMGLPERP